MSGIPKSMGAFAVAAAVAVAVPASGAAKPVSLAAAPTPGTSSELLWDSCPSATDCVAVGDYQNAAGARLNQVVRWNGKKWSTVRVPQPGGKKVATDYAQLRWVTCRSGSACWAVGTYLNPAGAYLNEALRWNGKKWALVKTPQPGGKGAGADSQLWGVSCPSASDCWAGGYYNGANAPLLNELLHWNGKKWREVKVQNPAGTGTASQNGLDGVTCLSRSDCWAPGFLAKTGTGYYNENLHWNGKKWSSVRVPQPGGKAAGSYGYLEQVGCASASDCWSVGQYKDTSTGTYVGEMLHWNGKKWSEAKIPEPPKGSVLGGVACTSRSYCWAVGNYVTKANATRNEVLRWNGKQWRKTTPAQPNAWNSLNGIDCVSDHDCWAVGEDGPNSGALENQALHWNGKQWKAR